MNERAPHLVADLCEIIAYFENREVSRGDIETFLQEKGGDGLFSELHIEDSESAEVNEKLQALSEEVMRHLMYRQAAFAEWYPFVVEADILVPVDDMTDRHRSYAALLGFSRLKMFSKAHISRYAADFEKFCLQAAYAIFGDWNILHFGAGGKDRPAFGNKLKDAFDALAKTLNEIAVPQNIAELSDNDVGDGGIDIVIFKKWRDDARSVPSYFAQCASQQDNWPTKRFEASSLNLRKYFNFFHDPGTILFIPVCYRDLNGKWINSDGHTTILIDRLRLIELLEVQISRSGGDPTPVLGNVPKPFELGCATAA